MYIAVKSLAVAGFVVVISIQPGADAARAPYAPGFERSDVGLSSALFNPYADGMAGAFELRDIAPGSLPTVFERQLPVAMLPPEAPEPLVAHQYPAIEPLDAAPPAAEPVTPQPEIVQPAQPAAPPADLVPPAAAIPDPAPRAAVAAPKELAPQEVAPKDKPRDLPKRRQAARPMPRAEVIAFDGPAGAPFAHTRFCLKYPDECRVSKQKLKFRGGPIELTAERRQELMRVNADVNRSIVGTRMNEPVAQEQWVISPKFGDCNDYAVTKRHKLIASGWPARALLLAEVVTNWGEHHLVLVVRTRQGDLVADNLNANLRNWTKTDYQWVRIESPVNPLFWSKLKAPQPDVVAMNASGNRL